MMVHELKCWPEYFQAIWDGSKKAEVRKDDRGFRTGDILVLHEWNRGTPGEKEPFFTGRWVRAEITHRTDYEQKEGFVVLSVGLLGRFDR